MSLVNKKTLLLSLMSLALIAPQVRADEAIIGVDNAFQGENNIFKTSEAQVGVANYEISPSLLLRRRDDEQLEYSLFYQPSFDAYFGRSNLNGVDHFFRANVGYRPSEVGRAWFRANLGDYRSIRAADAPTDGIPDVLGGAPGRVNRFFLNAGYDHEITRLTRVEATVGLQTYRFETPNNVDSTGFGGLMAVRNKFLPFADAGLSLFSSFRRYEELRTQPASRNVVVNPNFVMTIEPMETLVFDFSVGPAWIRTEQPGGGDALVPQFRASDLLGPTFGAAFDPVGCLDSEGRLAINSCPIIQAPALSDRLNDTVVVGFAPGQTPTAIDDSGVTAFATVSATKLESWGSIEAEYFRREDAAAGSGSTTMRDSVTGTVSFRPGWRFDVQLRANWNRRLATSNINRSIIEAGPSTVSTGDGRFFAQSVALLPNVVTNDIEIKQIWFDAIVGRPIFIDTLRVEGRFQYLKQQRPDQPIVGTFDNFFGEIRLIYRFDAIHY